MGESEQEVRDRIIRLETEKEHQRLETVRIQSDINKISQLHSNCKDSTFIMVNEINKSVNDLSHSVNALAGKVEDVKRVVDELKENQNNSAKDIDALQSFKTSVFTTWKVIAVVATVMTFIVSGIWVAATYTIDKQTDSKLLELHQPTLPK